MRLVFRNWLLVKAYIVIKHFNFCIKMAKAIMKNFTTLQLLLTSTRVWDEVKG